MGTNDIIDGAYLPKALLYAQKIWDSWRLESVFDEDEQVQVWEGFLTGSLEKVGVSQGNYSRVFAILNRGGAIKRRSRGGPGTPTQIVLVKRPDMEVYEKAKISGKLNTSQKAVTEDKLKQYATSIAKIEENIKTLVKTLANFGDRLSDLEAGGVVDRSAIDYGDSEEIFDDIEDTGGPVEIDDDLEWSENE